MCEDMKTDCDEQIRTLQKEEMNGAHSHTMLQQSLADGIKADDTRAENEQAKLAEAKTTIADKQGCITSEKVEQSVANVDFQQFLTKI